MARVKNVRGISDGSQKSKDVSEMEKLITFKSFLFDWLIDFTWHKKHQLIVLNRNTLRNKMSILNSFVDFKLYWTSKKEIYVHT